MSGRDIYIIINFRNMKNPDWKHKNSSSNKSWDEGSPGVITWGSD